MQSVKARIARLCISLAVAVGSWAALAGYDFASIDYPGAAQTQVFGINNQGTVVGNGYSAVASFPFTYDSRKGVFTDQPPAPGWPSTGLLGINEAGVMVGSVETLPAPDDTIITVGLIRGKKGTSTFFSKPGWPRTQARAIGSSGLVSGFSWDDEGNYIGFIYDPSRDSFIDIVPSLQTLPLSLIIAQGFNARGQVVGGIRLAAGGAYQGSPPGHYGWLRAPDGAITLLRVNGLPTRVRGINDSGLVTGWVNDPISGHSRGFVAKPVGLPGYEPLSVPETELFEMPGAYSTIPGGINNAGQIVGVWSVEPDPDPDAPGPPQHGFIATPQPKAKP